MAKGKGLLRVLLILLVCALLYFLFWPVDITPGSWTPAPTPPLTGQYEQNSKLAPTQRLVIGMAYAPEDVAIDSEDRIYAGLDDGRIVRLQPDGTKPEVFVQTHGRPLGLAFDANGNLIVADAIKGLLSISRTGAITILSTEADGIPFLSTNDLDIARDGTIYFTDSSIKFSMREFKKDILESQPNGRLLAYDPASKQTRVVKNDLCFANGVAVSPDQSFVLINETGRYRIHRVWLSGPKQGSSDIFIENLPGFPDGISSNGGDKFWLALVTPRDATLDKLLPYPFLRKVVARLPAFLQPAPKRYSFVLGLDTNGKVVENLQDPSKDCFAEIANVLEHKGALYFGSIGERAVGRFKLP
jgi:sugar lactone lactonase YvrE